MDALVQDYPQLLEFDLEMNEFHILHSNRSGKLQVYYCVGCGGNPPQSRRHTFFEDPSESDYDKAWRRIADLNDENDFIREFGAPSHVFDIPPLPETCAAIYGMTSIKKQWTFEPAESLISYYLQRMADDTYQKSLSPKHKKRNST